MKIPAFTNKIKIGVPAFRFGYYSNLRNIIGLVPDAEYSPLPDLFSMQNRLANRLNRLAGRELFQTFDRNNQFNDLDLNRVDLLHLFNSISYGRRPWVTTFETLVPRFRLALRPEQMDKGGETRLRKGLTALAGKACKKLIALSKCSLGYEIDLLKRFPDYRQQITNKMIVLHPGQATLMDKYEDKPVSPPGKVRFMFVGAAFFRKGGRECVDVLKTLREAHGFDLELVLVSSFKVEDYATRESPEDVRRYQAIVQENADWIRHYPSLPNLQVLEWMKNSHVGLLPTHADSYGYSVLEFQSAGCPVISTDVRALAEINNDRTGWLIRVPKDRLGEARYASAEQRQALSGSIRTGLEQAVREIFNDPDSIRRKGELSIERISLEHSPADRTRRLCEIYTEAMNA
jgi:glycosyltransferase involved in cell wall biosynthesis